MPFVLIGGKSNNDRLDKIEKHIAKMTNKECPTFLYCPYAAKNTMKSINSFHELMKNINCNIIDLDINNLFEFEEKLKIADCLYIGGGSCDDLVAFFKENKLDEIIAKYIDTNIIFAGVSAGAMLWCRYAMGDKYMYSDNFHSYNYKMVECLGILDINICPHYNNDDLIIYNDEIKNYDLDSFGIEDDTALVIDNNSYYVIKDKSFRSVYYFNKNDRLMKPLYEGENYEKNGGFRS